MLDIGASHGALLPHLADESAGFGVTEVVQVDSSAAMIMRDAHLPEHSPPGITVHRLAWDEECLMLPPGAISVDFSSFPIGYPPESPAFG